MPRLVVTLCFAILSSACVFNTSGLGPTDLSRPAAEQSPVDGGHDAGVDRSQSTDLPDGTLPPDLAPPDGPVSDTLPPLWWNTAWKRRRRVTFDNSAQGSALIDVPVLILLKAGRIDYAATRSGGADLRFVDADGQTVLAHEIEAWNAQGSSFIWVKVPRIDGGSTTDHIWLYHDNPAAQDGQQAATVWSNGYQAVWHLHDDLDDSTAQGQNATNHGSTDTAGRIADGQALNGVDQYIDTGYTKNPTKWTTAAWVRGAAAPTGTYSGQSAISGPLMKEETFQLTWDHVDSTFRGAASLKTTGSNWKAASFGALQGKTWYWLAATYDGATLRAYRDGSPSAQTAVSGNPVNRSDSAKIGRHCFRTDVHPYLHGKVDEVRIAHVVRSDDWIAAQHLSMTDAFASFGAEESIP